MKNLDLVLENVCIRHINKNSRLSEAADKAIRENKIGVLCEAFDSVITESANKSNGKVKQFFLDSWNNVKKFFLTLMNKIKSVAMDYNASSKSDIDFINKNKDKVNDALSKLTDEERTTKFADTKYINPSVIGMTMIDDLFMNCDTTEEMQVKVDHNVKSVWNRTFDESDIKDTANESKSDMVYRLVFVENIINESVNMTKYISELSTNIDEIVKSINILSSILVNIEKAVIVHLEADKEDINNEFIKLVIDKYKICIKENLTCLKLALDICVKSRNNTMSIIKKAIKQYK